MVPRAVKRTAPVVPGFRFSGVHCGIKPGRPDLALIVSDVPASAAGVFTRSTVVGAPVALSRERVRSGRARAVVVNSGVSNVAMGKRGDRDALAMARAGLTREESYRLIQRNAMRAWETGAEFQDLLRGDAEVRAHLGDEELARCFDREHHLRHVDRILERAFEPDEGE